MKKGIKLIIACILSLTIIYVGGVPQLIHNYCACCDLAHNAQIVEKACCELNDRAEFRKFSMFHPVKPMCSCPNHHQKGCCKNTVLKIDLQKESQDNKFIVPNVSFRPQDFHLVDVRLFEIKWELFSFCEPPKPDSSRFYLNLYSTLII